MIFWFIILLGLLQFDKGDGTPGTSSGNVRHTQMLPCGVEIAATPVPERNSSKWKDVLLGVNQTFAHVDAFKDALHKFSIAHDFEYHFSKNSFRKMYVRCKVVGCPWRINAKQVGQGGPFMRVTKFKNDHIHNGQYMLGMRHSATARRTSTIIIDEVRDHIDKKPKELMTTLSREYGVKLTYKQAYRAKEKELEEIQGSPSQSYMMIPWICERLKETDNGTVAEYKATPDNTFECVFVAYGYCIHGFLAGARPVLYIDGTHLSGP